MRPPVLTKSDMYRRMVAGEFGNTLQRWFDFDDWARTGALLYPLWGVQHTTLAGFPGTRLDVHRDGVADRLRDGGFGASDYCISPMVHQVGTVLWEGDVYADESGLCCYGHRFPSPGSWRQHMRSPDVWQFTKARMLLRGLMTPNSYDDLMELLDLYPGHAVELSVLDVCFGTCPGRNAITWEVRKY